VGNERPGPSTSTTAWHQDAERAPYTTAPTLLGGLAGLAFTYALNYYETGEVPTYEPY